MKDFEIEKKVQVGNFTIGIIKESEVIVFTTTPTEENNGGVMLALVDPMRDGMTYATLRQLFDMVSNDGDKAGENLLQNYCISLFIVRSNTLCDATYVDALAKASLAMQERVRGEEKKAGKKLGIKEETSKEALDKMAEQEEIESIH